MALNLLAFDFDHTIVDDNSDTVVAGLLDGKNIPESTKNLYRRDGWTAYMQEIFKLLHQYNYDKDTVLNSIKKIPPVPGIVKLIQEARENYNYHIIIISDSNTIFIETWLKAHDLNDAVDKIFSNPAEFDETGLLNIKMYHLQDYCKLSSKNLCKGQILLDFLKEQQKKNIHYERVIYCGDGSNDFCPILKLKESDVGCVRNNYKCVQLIEKIENGQKIDNKSYELKCGILKWNDCYDILNHIKSL